jgi:hypothetical protein
MAIDVGSSRVALAFALALALPGCYRGAEGGGGADTDGDSEGEGGEAEGGAADPFCEEESLPGSLSRFVRLTHRQYDNTVRDLLGVDTQPSAGFLGDPSVGGFANNADQLVVTDRLARDYRRAAEEIAGDLVADPQRLASLVTCDGNADPEGCARTFITEFGRRAFRRDLEPEEVDAFFGRYQAGAGLYDTGSDFEQGIAMVIESMLQAPSFLYRAELSAPAAGSDLVALSGYEIATRLSYMLWNSMPDDALLDAALAGELDTTEGIETHARRLLDDPRAADPIGDFHAQWLKMDRYPNITKDPDAYPGFDPATPESMQDETTAFFRHVILEEAGTFADLMTSRTTFVDARTAPIYGLAGDFGEVPTQVELDAATRSGFLTQPGFLALNAYFAETSPIHRGVFVQRQILCTDIPDPPGDADLELPPFDDSLRTTRQRVEHHTSGEACAGCHQLINEPGFAFEGYDAIGSVRTDENGEPLDTTGSIMTPEGLIEFTDAVDLIGQLAESPTAQKCYLTQWFRYASSRSETDDDECSLDGLHESLGESGYDVRELLVALTQTTSFRYRAAQEVE